MPRITADGSHLTVLNLFTTDTPQKQESLLEAMREIVDSAAYPGWISSTVHSGEDSPGTANFIQWRSTEDLEARYSGEEFKHRTLPLFREITTSIRLLQNEVAHTRQRAGAPALTEIAPDRDDYTAIEILGVAQEDQEELVTGLGEERDWLEDVPGFRTHTVLRGLRGRGIEGSFVVSYSQWDSKEAYDAFVSAPESERSAARRSNEKRVDALSTYRDGNTYRVTHSRSAG